MRAKKYKLSLFQATVLIVLHAWSIGTSHADVIPATTLTESAADSASGGIWLSLVIALTAVLVGLVVLLAWNTSLRRTLERRGLEMEAELVERQRVESELKQTRDDLEHSVRTRTLDLETRNLELDETRIALQEANKRLRKQVSVDGLTGISNRRHFDEVLAREIRRALRACKPLSLILCDIDGFKAYNDTYGHVRGDETLQKVAAVVDETFRRAGDLSARYGGEEFVIILPGADAETAQRFGERLRENVWKLAIPHAASQVADRITVSCGVATIEADRVYTAEEIIQAADLAMYNAKKGGRNRVAQQTKLDFEDDMDMVS